MLYLSGLSSFSSEWFCVVSSLTSIIESPFHTLRQSVMQCLLLYGNFVMVFSLHSSLIRSLLGVAEIVPCLHQSLRSPSNVLFKSILRFICLLILNHVFWLLNLAILVWKFSCSMLQMYKKISYIVARVGKIMQTFWQVLVSLKLLLLPTHEILHFRFRTLL